MKKRIEITAEELGFDKSNIIHSVGEHNVYFKSHHKSLGKDTELFRYITLSTLIDMFYYGTLYASNIQSFSDIREKRGMKKDIIPVQMINPVPSYHDRIRINCAVKDKQRALSICVSCWTTDDRGNCGTDESFLMWKSYTGNELTCRIATNLDKLVKSLCKSEGDIVISDVAYNDNYRMTDYEKLVFRKSIHYEQEQEIRMAVLCNDHNGSEIGIDVGNMISEIRLSPFIQPNMASFILEGLQKRCARYPNIKLSYSDILEYRCYK